MALAVVHRRRVGQDLAAGFDYYATQGPELGEKFLRAVTSVVEAIGRYPQMFSAVHGEVRRAILSGFPYAVFTGSNRGAWSSWRYCTRPAIRGYGPGRARTGNERAGITEAIGALCLGADRRGCRGEEAAERLGGASLHYL